MLAIFGEAAFFEFAQQFLLSLREVNRRLDDDMAKQIAMGVTAYPLDAFAAQPEGPAGLGFRWNLDLGNRVERRDFDFATERRRRKTDRHFTVQVVAFALEDRVRLQVNLHVQVAGGAAIDAVFSFAGKTNPISLVDTCRDLDGQGLVLLDAACTMA